MQKEIANKGKHECNLTFWEKNSFRKVYGINK